MNRTEINLCKGFIYTLLAGMLATAGLWRCARITQPQGGPKDSLPPVVITMTPAYGTVDFKEKRVYIEFNEYVQLKDQQKEFYTSPFMKKTPLVSLRGRGIQVDIKDTLLPNQTYSLNFGRSVADNNEGNPYTGLRYVFSTGSEIDSLMMSGYSVDAYTSDTVGNVFLLFYDPKADSVPERDSTVFQSKPLAVGRAFPNGIFLVENLKPMDYRVYALEDNNGNRQYEAGVDRIAFLDSTYNPATMPAFDIWYDSSRMYLQAQPQILMRMFMDEPSKRQTYSSSARPMKNKIQLYFTAPHPKIEELSFDSIDPGAIVTEYLTPKHDSMELVVRPVENRENARYAQRQDHLPRTRYAEQAEARHGTAKVGLESSAGQREEKAQRGGTRGKVTESILGKCYAVRYGQSGKAHQIRFFDAVGNGGQQCDRTGTDPGRRTGQRSETTASFFKKAFPTGRTGWEEYTR